MESVVVLMKLICISLSLGKVSFISFYDFYKVFRMKEENKLEDFNFGMKGLFCYRNVLIRCLS